MYHEESIICFIIKQISVKTLASHVSTIVTATRAVKDVASFRHHRKTLDIWSSASQHWRENGLASNSFLLSSLIRVSITPSYTPPTRWPRGLHLYIFIPKQMWKSVIIVDWLRQFGVESKEMIDHKLVVDLIITTSVELTNSPLLAFHHRLQCFIIIHVKTLFCIPAGDWSHITTIYTMCFQRRLGVVDITPDQVSKID